MRLDFLENVQMSCPTDVNTGLLSLSGTIPATQLASRAGGQHDGIRMDTYPLRISFAPASTPSLQQGPSGRNNSIYMDNLSSNTCRYQSNAFTLVDIQLSKSMHTGYLLPTETDTPMAELIFSYSSNSSQSKLSGILLCLPIYEGEPDHSSFLTQLVRSSMSPVSAEEIFFSSEEDTSQVSLAYKTCFEMFDAEQIMSHGSLYVVVFPHGIHLSQADFLSLQSQSVGNQSLPSYYLPPALRNGEPTVTSYTWDEDGNKTATGTSTQGLLYTTTLSTCTEEFTHRFEYFVQPPKRTTQTASNKTSTQDTCYTTSQYKCVPFHQLTDLSGNYVIVGNQNTSLQSILDAQAMPTSSDEESASSDIDWEDVGITVGSVVGLVALVFLIGKALPKFSDD